MGAWRGTGGQGEGGTGLSGGLSAGLRRDRRWDGLGLSGVEEASGRTSSRIVLSTAPLLESPPKPESGECRGAFSLADCAVMSGDRALKADSLTEFVLQPAGDLMRHLK